MKVRKGEVGLITNWEVLGIITEKYPNDGTEGEVIASEIDIQVAGYLEQSPAGQVQSEHITQLAMELDRFELTKHEKLQIINLAPTSKLELNILVEQCAERFIDDYQDEILVAVSTAYPNLFSNFSDEDQSENLNEGNDEEMVPDEDGKNAEIVPDEDTNGKNEEIIGDEEEANSKNEEIIADEDEIIADDEEIIADEDEVNNNPNVTTTIIPDQ